MLISELIDELQDILHDYGDVTVAFRHEDDTYDVWPGDEVYSARVGMAPTPIPVLFLYGDYESVVESSEPLKPRD